MIAGSCCGFLPNAGHVRTACCGHHGTYKDLRETFWGQRASVTISLQQGYRLGIPFGMLKTQGRKGTNWNQKAPYNLNGCQDNEISHCIPLLPGKHK